MTRTLILTRHAKSSWDNPGLSDHERPLNKRGRRSAPAIGAWLRENGWMPDEVLSSTSNRTRETWDGMGLKANKVRFHKALYHADAEDMLRELAGATEPVILMLGHNPGIAEFASQLVRQSPDHMRFLDYPTCATTVMTFDADSWSDVRWHTGTVLGFTTARELLE